MRSEGHKYHIFSTQGLMAQNLGGMTNILCRVVAWAWLWLLFSLHHCHWRTSSNSFCGTSQGFRRSSVLEMVFEASCLHFLVETQSVQSAPAGGKLTPYPADFILWCNVRCRFYVTAHAVQQSSDADFYPYTQSTASMILV